MKIFRFFSIAVLSLTIASCSNNDNILETGSLAEAGKMPFTATIAPPASNATTRTVFTEEEKEDGSYINVAWKVGDKIALIHGGRKDVVSVSSIAEDGSATISGTVNEGQDDDDVMVVYPEDVIDLDEQGSQSFGTFWAKLFAQDGTLKFIADNLDARQGQSKLTIKEGTVTLSENVEMESACAIWKLTLKDNSSSILTANKVTIKDDGTAECATTNINASEVYLAMLSYSFEPLTIEAEVGDDIYAFSKEKVSLDAGTFYQSEVTMTKKNIDLSNLSTDYEANDGDILTGTNDNVKISIADNATVTLKDATIKSKGDWAGITCNGHAKIILMGTNTVTGNSGYSGIFIVENEQLIIEGDGSLTATGGDYAAGIGSSKGISCGQITIEGGTITAQGGCMAAGIGSGYRSECDLIHIVNATITATGGEYAAGIGSGDSDTESQPSECSYININGGTITATGGKNAAGIGSGGSGTAAKTSKFNDLYISPDVTKLTAIKGEDASYSIGPGSNGTFGTLSFGVPDSDDKVVAPIETSPYIYPEE